MNHIKKHSVFAKFNEEVGRLFPYFSGGFNRLFEHHGELTDEEGSSDGSQEADLITGIKARPHLEKIAAHYMLEPINSGDNREREGVFFDDGFMFSPEHAEIHEENTDQPEVEECWRAEFKNAHTDTENPEEEENDAVFLGFEGDVDEIHDQFRPKKCDKEPDSARSIEAIWVFFEEKFMEPEGEIWEKFRNWAFRERVG